MAPSNKKTSETVTAKLGLVIKSGKYTLGYQSTLKALRRGQAKVVIIAANTPPLRKSEIEYYALLAKCHVHLFNGSNNDLGTACGRLFSVGMVSVLDPGDSDILQTIENVN